MDNEKAIVPKLCFPGFNESWVTACLGDVFTFMVTNSYSRENLNYKNGLVKNIHYGDIHTKFSTLFNISNEVVPYIKTEIDIRKIKEENFCKEGDIIFADASEDLNDVGKSIEIVNINNEKLVAGLHTIHARPSASLFSLGFIGYLFKTEFIRKQIQKVSQGTKVLSISSTRLQKIIIHYPLSIINSNKIASCLSSLDDLITAHTQKLKALQQHKKGLMQNLFPSEGQTIPKLRFKEFENSGEWVISKIENYIDLLCGIALKGEELSDDKSGIPILRGINITEGRVRHSKEMDKYYLGNFEAINRYLVKENDLVIAMDGSKVGKNVSLIKKEDEGSILIQRVARIKTNEKSDIKYIYQHIISEKFQKYVDKVNTSTGIPHISAQQIKDFEIGFPTLEEQKKIASCLSSLDKLITAQIKKIEQLKQHKKGLMQGLFPRMSEL